MFHVNEHAVDAAILTIMATSLLMKNLHDMTEQISPLRMRSRHGLETVKVFALPLMAGAAELPLLCMVDVDVLVACC